MKVDEIKKITETIVEINRQEEIDEKLHEIDKKQAVKEAVDEARKDWWKTVHTVCITATGAVLTGLYNLGSWLYANFEPLRIGVSAMIQAMRGHQ